MRLFLYYALHSLKNQIKKLFKTWVFVFLIACFAFGGLIGVGAAMLGNLAEDDTVEAEQLEEEFEDEDDMTLAERLGLDPADLVELIAGGVILVVFVIEALGADKNGSRIFLPADVNLLFASPMKPQSVLMFRLTSQLGVALLASAYLLFQLPTLIHSVGLSVWAALAVVAAWALTVMIGKLLQTLLYTICSAHPRAKARLRRSVYLILALIAAAFVLYQRRSGLGWLDAATAFFCSGVSRYIPFWGWIKGFVAFAARGETACALLCLAAVVLGGGALAYAIWHIKADFYEDAMARSEETAELLERAQTESSGVARRKKDRSEKLRRDGMRHGAGANVFFFKTLYNRFRFAHLGFLTKTTETYLVAAAGMAALCRYAAGTDSLIPVSLVLAGLTFFRTLGNPLEQDTKMGFFLLIPESTRAKLFWSLLGGTANCLLDLLPAMLAAVLILGANPLIALAWLPFIVSVDFYGTSVGTFIGLSVPVSAGKTIKQIVQVMFIYFGLLPDAAVVAAGLLTGHAPAGVIGAAVINIALGFLFFQFSPRFLDPKSIPPAAYSEARK